MKRKMKVIAVIMALATVLSACGGGTTSSGGGSDANGAAEDKTITFWNVGTEGADREIFEYAIRQFNENTQSGYTVINQPTQNDKYKEKLVIAMSSGECPDMYTSWTGGPMNEYIDSGYAKPLDDLYEQTGIEERFMEGALEQASYKGVKYAVPVKNISVAGIYYNKDLFAGIGVEVPASVAELETVCDTLLKNGILPFALANGPKWTGSMYFQNLAVRKGGLEPFRDAVSGKGSFEDECFLYAGEKIQEWVKKGYFPDGYNSMSEDDGQAKQLFYTERAAMYLTGSWNTAAFKTDSEDGGSDFYSKIGWFNFPSIDGSDADASIMIGTLGDQFISFNCSGEKLEAAFEFATYLSNDDIVDVFVERSLTPPLKGIENKVTDPVAKQIVDAANEAAAVQLWYDQYLSPSVANAHLDGNQEVFGLIITPEAANKKMQEAQQKVLAEEQ